MTLKKRIEQNHDQIQKIAKENGIVKISIFGSVAKGDDRPDSDIDFLVEAEEDCSLFDLIRFKQSLEQLLQRKVDVVTEQAVHWAMRDQIKNEAVRL